MATLVVAGGTTTWTRTRSASKRMAIWAAKRTATSAVSERSVATRTRPTIDGPPAEESVLMA